MASKPKYFTIEFNGEEMVVFYPQYKEDDEWIIVSKDNPFPVELTEHNNTEITDLLKSIQKSQEETKEQSELLAELISEMEKLATGPQGEPFRYEDFTEEQLEGLRGPKGDPFEFDDFTDEQLESFTNAAKEEVSEEIADHTESKSNPHEVTKSQVGLGSVDNVKQVSKANFDSHTSESSGKHVSESDSGSSYIRFDDGTQMCFEHFQLEYASGSRLGGTWIFPKEFINPPTVTVTFSDVTSNFTPTKTKLSYIGLDSVPDKDSASPVMYRYSTDSNFEEGDTAWVQCYAIGRWK